MFYLLTIRMCLRAAATDRNGILQQFRKLCSDAYIDSNASIKIMSGTFMAAPYAIGVVALLIGYLDHLTRLNIYKQM